MERRSVVAISFVVLLLVSTITMGGAAASFDRSTDRQVAKEPSPPYLSSTPVIGTESGSQSNSSPESTLPTATDPRLVPGYRLAVANATLHQIEPASNRERRSLDRASDHLATALEHYRFYRATDRRAFDTQARALHALSRAAGGEHDATLRNLSRAIPTASNETASFAIRDANGSLQTFSDQLDGNAQRFVERALRNARSGFDRADPAATLPGAGDGRYSLRRTIQAQANAIDHYRYAYHQAGRAMDRMERAIEPELTLSQGQAFERNGSTYVALEARLTDVRPYAYDRASVTVTNGTGNASAITFQPTNPGKSSTVGRTLVDLGTDADNVTVIVRSNASHDRNRQVEATIDLSVDGVEVIPDPPASDEFNEIEVHNESTGVSVEAGGDGLWDEELRVTNETPATEQSFRAGPIVRVESQTSISNGTVRIPIDESVPDSAYRNLSVYTRNSSIGAQWTSLNTTIENGTAIAHVDHFSFFTIFNDISWREAITRTIDTGSGSQRTPIRFNETQGFDCENACNVTNGSTLVVGGTPQSQEIVVEQGNETFEVVPMSNGERIEEFYNYGNSQINSPLPIAESETSRLFFWAGPEGLSLVVLHDEPYDGSGSAVDMAFDGLPTTEGSWVIEDDPGHDFHSNTQTDISWKWSHRRTDGGAFRGGLTNRTIDISAQFNEEASRFAGGRLDHWQLLTGQATEPSTIGLDMDQPVTVHVPEAPTENATDLAGDSGAAIWNDTLPDDTAELSLLYQTEQTDVDPEATLVLRDEDNTTVRHDLTIGSTGTIQESVDVSALEGTVEYTLDVSGVNARFRAMTVESNARVDSDGDGIPDALEEQRWTMPRNSYQSFTTSAHDADTDGDGVPDGEEIQFRTIDTPSGTEYVLQATSNPIWADSDDDGISDRRELEGWEIQYTDSREATLSFVDALRGESIDQDAAAAHLTTREVISNPLEEDSEGDGLSDLEERRMGTGPYDSDTTGDGIQDSVALEEGNDPTLFDATPPEIDEHYAEISSDGGWDFWNNLDVKYTADFSVHDEAGLANTTVFLDREKARTIPLSGENGQHENTYTRGFLNKFDTVWSGSTIIVEATDRHGNTRQRLVERQQSVPADAAVEASKLPGSISTVEYLGALNGFLTAVSDSGYEVKRFISNPDTYLITVITSLSNIAQLDEIPAVMEQRQEQANPFEESQNQADHLDYEGGWYTGYAAWIGVTVLVPAGELVTIARNSQLVASTVSRLGQGNRLVRAGQFVMQTYDGARAVPGRVVDYGTVRMVRVGSDLSEAAARGVLDPARTAVHRYEVAEQTRRLTPNYLESLSPSESSRLGRFFARYGDDGGRLMADGGDDLRDLIVRSDGLDEDTTRALLRAHARGDLDDAALQRTARYLDESRMDQADVRRMEEMLETRNSDPMLDDDLGANDLLDIVDQNGDLSDARMIVQRRGSTPGLDSDSVWLEEGTAGVNGDAWRKIVDKHGDQLIGKYDNIDTEADIERMIRNGIDNPDRVIATSDGKARFIYTVDEGDTPVSIFVGSNGYIQSAYTRSE